MGGKEARSKYTSVYHRIKMFPFRGSKSRMNNEVFKVKVIEGRVNILGPKI